MFGAPGEIRTPDLMVRSHALYPTELRARTVKAHKYVGPRADGGELPSNQGVAFASPLDPLELSGGTNAGREPSRGAHPTTSTPESSRPRVTFLPAADRSPRASGDSQTQVARGRLRLRRLRFDVHHFRRQRLPDLV